MNQEYSHPKHAGKAGRGRGLAAFCLLACISFANSFAAEPATSDSKEFSLFVGGNLQVPDGSAYLPVQGVTRNSLLVDSGKSVRKVSMDEVKEYRMTREPKLAVSSATIRILKSDRFQAGAARARLEELSNNVAVQTEMVERQARALGASVRASTIPNTKPQPIPGVKDDPSKKTVRDESIYNAESEFSKVAMGNDLNSGFYSSMKSVESATHDDCDALDLTFDISSARQLANTHIVVVTECRDPRNPDTLLRMITPKFVGGIGMKPSKVSIEQGGFPKGFALVKVRVFLYSGGNEVVTNLSDDRIDLTRDQAYKYLLVQYIASHGKDSLPPSPVMGAMPGNFQFKAESAELGRSVVIHVNKEGEVTAINTEDNQPAALSPSVLLALKAFRFFPALKNGQPAEGSLKVRITDLIRDT